MEDSIKCPKCQSTQVSANKKGWSLTTGFIGSGKIKITCLKCGHKFNPGEDYESIQEQKEALKTVKQSPWFKIFAAVFFTVVLIAIIQGNSGTDDKSSNASQSNTDTPNQSQTTSKEDSLANIKWGKSKAGKIQKKHPDWTKDECEGVADHKIWIGMSLDMLKSERGNPTTVNISNYGNGNSYQWCWDGYTPSCFYGTENQIITSFN